MPLIEESVLDGVTVLLVLVGIFILDISIPDMLIVCVFILVIVASAELIVEAICMAVPDINIEVEDEVVIDVSIFDISIFDIVFISIMKNLFF
jgi:hypothetical protein